jgi:hypothetical protein
MIYFVKGEKEEIFEELAQPYQMIQYFKPVICKWVLFAFFKLGKRIKPGPAA